MSDKEVSNENLLNKKTDSSKINSALLYIIVPMVFVAVMLVFLIPAVIAADKTADKYISLLMMQFENCGNDILTVDDKPYVPDYTDSGDVALQEGFSAGDRIGTLVCENAGVNTDIYYGSGVQISTRGAGVSSDYSLFGESGSVLLEGFGSSGFKNYENFSAGDIIHITTVYGTFEYKVTDESAETSDADLIMRINDAKAPFYSGTERFVCADKISGPALKLGEVQK